MFLLFSDYFGCDMEVKITNPISGRKFPAQFPDIFVRLHENAANQRGIYGFRRNPRESLLNPCPREEFADSGQNMMNQARNRKKSLINSLRQGIGSHQRS
jgi:hypothetical protein